jgi:hypothetical protein
VRRVGLRRTAPLDTADEAMLAEHVRALCENT